MSEQANNEFQMPNTALVLSGGGARAAFQVGAVRAISDIVYRKERGNPFPILTGTSAGSINATVLASYATNPRLGVRSLQKVWSNFSVDQVFRSNFSGIAKNSWRWAKSMFISDYHRKHRLGLFDNSPLVELLERVINFGNIQKSVDAGALKALAITASGYTSGESISFFQGHESIENWRRYRRCGARAKIRKEHLLASAAIPLIFPAVRINREFFGDGSVRFLSPISPAIHLGAEKIMVIGVDPIREQSSRRPQEIHYPSVADIAGHVLDSVFIDSLDSDVERLNRINKTLSLIPDSVRNLQSNLRPIETFTLSPSKDLSLLACKHFKALPKIMQFFFSKAGIGTDEGSTVLSYLLFEAPYTQELIDLGYNDAMNRKDEIKVFFGV